MQLQFVFVWIGPFGLTFALICCVCLLDSWFNNLILRFSLCGTVSCSFWLRSSLCRLNDVLSVRGHSSWDLCLNFLDAVCPCLVLQWSLDAVSSLMDIHRRGKQIAADKGFNEPGRQTRASQLIDALRRMTWKGVTII